MKDCCDHDNADAKEPAPAAAPTADDCCAAKEGELTQLAQHADVKRVLVVVLSINFAMFLIEFAAGVAASSTALMADSVDMLGDALVYLLSLYALGRGLRWRAGTALTKGVLIAVLGVSIAVEATHKIAHGVVPVAGTMVVFGSLALVANLVCLGLLYRHRDRDVNLSSTFECSRNDVMANGGVLLAAAGVHWLESGWPDIAVGMIIAALFLRSAFIVIGEAWPQFRSARAAG